MLLDYDCTAVHSLRRRPRRYVFMSSSYFLWLPFHIL
jgi:hypothetical protein